MKLPFVSPCRLDRRRVARPAHCLAVVADAVYARSLRARIRDALQWSRLQNLVNRGYTSLDRHRGAPTIWRKPWL